MNYIRVQWLHKNATDPVLLVSELDDNRWETRKVETFADGSKGYAAKDEECGGTFLGLLPVPTIQDIAADSQFLPQEITREEFEVIWNSRFTS